MKKFPANNKTIVKGKRRVGVFNTILFPLLSLLIWELLEELIEIGIALTISSMLVKVISIFGFVVITTGIKYLIMQVVRSLTYKDGLDKTDFIKRLFDKIKEQKERLMFKKLSKIQIASFVAALLGIVYAVVSYFVPDIAILGDTVISTASGLGVASLSGIVGTFKDYADKTEDELKKAKARELEKLAKSKEKNLKKVHEIELVEAELLSIKDDKTEKEVKE